MNLETKTCSREKNSNTVLWEKILSEIDIESKKNASIALLLDKRILEAKTFEEALCSNLAANLSATNHTNKVLFNLFKKIVTNESKIIEFAIEDLLEIKRRDFAFTLFSVPFLFSKGYLALQTYRMAHYLYLQGDGILSSFIQSRAATIFGVDIAPSASLGKSIILDHGIGIVIGATSIVLVTNRNVRFL